MVKKVDNAIDAVKHCGKTIFGVYKEYKEFDRRIRNAFANPSRKYFTNKHMENKLYFLLYMSYYRVIIIHGGIAGGKSALADNLHSTLQCEKLDYNNIRDRLRLENNIPNNATDIVPIEKQVSNETFLIVDNILKLTSIEFDNIISYAQGRKTIIITREYELLPGNKSHAYFDFNKYVLKISNKLKRKINRRIWKNLPSFMKKPIFLDILSDETIRAKIEEDYELEQQIISLCRNNAPGYDPNMDQLSFIFEFFDVVFSIIPTEEIRLLILYSVIFRDSYYDESLLHMLFRKIHTNSFTSEYVYDKARNKVHKHYSEDYQSLTQTLKKYSFLMGNDGNQKYLHLLISEYFMYCFERKESAEKTLFINDTLMLAATANLNWLVKERLNDSLEERIRFAPYAYNLVSFFTSHMYLGFEIDQEDDTTFITTHYKSILHIKALLHLCNSYSFIILNVTSVKRELSGIYEFQKKALAILNNQNTMRDWIGKNKSKNKYYCAQTELFNVTAKICLEMALCDNNRDDDMLENAVYYLNEYKLSLGKISNTFKEYSKRLENYYYTISALLYKTALFGNLSHKISIDGNSYIQKDKMLRSALEYGRRAKKLSLEKLNTAYHISFETKGYNIEEYKKIPVDLYRTPALMSLLNDLRLECIIECIIFNQSNHEEYEKLIRQLEFAKHGFYITSGAHYDTIWYRISILINMLNSYDAEKIDRYYDESNLLTHTIINGNIKDSFYSKYLFLKNLVFCIKNKNYDETLLVYMFSLYQINFNTVKDISNESNVDFLKRVFYRLAIV